MYLPVSLSLLVIGRMAAGLSLAADAPRPGPASRPVQTTAGWVKYPDNPVLGGKLGTCFDVSLLKEGPVFRMWFSWRPKKSIALTESKDGIHWRDPEIVLRPNPDTAWESDINRPVVLHHAGKYHLWYTGQAGGRSWIGYATSADGRTWRRMSDKPVLAASEPWEKVAVMCPHVLWDEKTRLYRMWYSGGEQNEPNAIGYATSADGLIWKKDSANSVFRPDPHHRWEQDRVTGCQVVREPEGFVMFYIGFENEFRARIGIARSADGLAWDRHPANPIISTGDGAQWDADAVYKPFAIFDRGRWMLWYNGRRGGVEQIGLAVYEGRQLWPEGKERRGN